MAELRNSVVMVDTRYPSSRAVFRGCRYMRYAWTRSVVTAGKHSMSKILAVRVLFVVYHHRRSPSIRETGFASRWATI